MKYSTEDLKKGFIISDNHLAGIAQNNSPADPSVKHANFTAYVLKLDTAEYILARDFELFDQAQLEIQKFLSQLNAEKWTYEFVHDCAGSCSGERCGTDRCKKESCKIYVPS